MLRHIHVETTLFGPGESRAQTEKDLCVWLESLTRRNQHYLAAHPNTPRLYKSGVKYTVPKQFNGECYEVQLLKSVLGKAAKRSDVATVLALIQEVLGGEHFCDIGVILELGGMDCDGISSWRAAELRQAGIKAMPFMTSRTRLDGGVTYHALVRWPAIPGVPYETTEDPSLLLGMGGKARAKDRQLEIEKNAERCDHLRAARTGGSIIDPEIASLEEILGIRRLAPARGQVTLQAALDDILTKVAA